MAIEERVSALFLKHQAMLMEYVRALVRDPTDSKDVFQQVGVIILSKARVPDEDEAFPRWARGVARNEALHFWRTRKRARVIPDSRLVDAVDTAFQEADGESEEMALRREALDECMAKVQGVARETLMMRYTKGLSCQQIADAMRRKSAAVRVMLMRARDSLARCIDARLCGGSVP